MIVGDINFNLNSIDDPDSTTPKDIVDASGPKIHNNVPMHRHGNTLNILASEIASSLNRITSQPGPFFLIIVV